MARGALGYVPKSAGPNTLALRGPAGPDGDVYVPPLMLRAFDCGRLVGSARPGEPGRQILTIVRSTCSGGSATANPTRRSPVELGLSEKTVKAHVGAIFRALNVVNRTQAATIGREAGLI